MGNGAVVNAGIFNEALKEELINIYVSEFEKMKLADIADPEEAREMFAAALAAKESEWSTKSHRRLSSIKETVMEEEEDDIPASSKTKFANKSRNTFLVSIDGSAQADCAFSCAMSLRRKLDCMVIFHTHKSSVNMESLLPAYRAPEIQRKYTELLGHLPPELYHLAFIERKEHESVKGVLEVMLKKMRRQAEAMDRANSSKSANTPIGLFGSFVPDFLVIGYSGRRKEMENSVSVMGSSTDLALRSVPIPIIIAKRSSERENKIYVYSTDGKQKSRDGLDILLTLIMPRDTLIVLRVASNDMDGTILEFRQAAELEIKSYFEEELQRAGPVDSRYLAIERNAGESVADCIVNYSNNEINPDFLVIAPRAKKQMASITEEIIQKSVSSVILCKM